LKAGGSRQFWGVPVGSWVDPASNEMRDDVFVALTKHAVVLLGETHGEVEHHRWQLHTIAALFGHRPDMILCFEMFSRRVRAQVAKGRKIGTWLTPTRNSATQR